MGVLGRRCWMVCVSAQSGDGGGGGGFAGFFWLA